MSFLAQSNDGGRVIAQKQQVMFMSQRKQLRQLTRRQKWIRDNVTPLVYLLVIIFSALAVTWVVTEPLMHPNLHPRLSRLGHRLGHEIIHHHPRLLKVAEFGGISALLLLYISCLSLPLRMKAAARKKGLLNKAQTQLSAFFDKPHKQSFTLDTPAAWQNLKACLPGLLIKIPDVRQGHWEILEADDRRLQLKAALTYTHEPLGLQPSRLYPRTIWCTATVSGTGIRSDIQLAYKALSAMDFRNVCAIIDQTNNAIRESLRNDSHIETMLASDAAIRAGGALNGAIPIHFNANSSCENDQGKFDQSVDQAHDRVEVVSSTLELESTEQNPIPEYKFYMPV